MAAAATEPHAAVDRNSARRQPNALKRQFEPVPIALLVQFRIALGLILLWEAYRYLSAGWPRSLFLEPGLLFYYYGFEWVRPLPEPLHLAVVPTLGVLAVFVTFGLFYRVAAALLFFGWAYVFLLDQALYLNHLYLVTLIIGLATLLPANRAFALDVRMRPRLRSETAPRWTLTLLRAQVGLVYFFGGVAKLNPDWLSGVPMQQMLLERADLIGQPAGEPWVALVFAYSGLLLDLFIVPLLWWKKTRIAGLLAIAAFHLTNHMLFRIGIFPWFMMAATLILWPPAPLSLLSFGRIYGSLVGIGMVLTLVADRDLPGWAWGVAIAVGALLAFPPDELRRFDLDPAPEPTDPPADAVSPQIRPAVLVLLGVYLGWQFLMPLRHFAYDLRDGRYGDDVSWTEQGHKWSWHMKLRIKRPTSAAFFVIDGDGRTTGMYQLRPVADGLQMMPIIDPVGLGTPLSPRQSRTMVTRPDLILQFAHFLRDRYASQAKQPLDVRASIQVSLNDRPPEYLIDPEANLAVDEPRLWPPAEWILPLEAPAPELRRVDVRRLLEMSQPHEAGVDADEL